MLTRAAKVCTLALAVYLLAPLLVIIPVSMTDRNVLSLPSEALSLQHYANLFGSRPWLNAALQSIVIGVVSATLATALAFLAAAAVWLNGGRLAKVVLAMAIAPMVVPSIVIALGLYKLYAATGLIDTYTGVIAAHTIIALPYPFVLSLAGLSGLRPTLFLTARSLGAGPVSALWRVILPSTRVAVFSGWIFAFLHSWDELLITMFVSSRTVHTLPRMMWDGLNENFDPIIAAVSVLLLLLSTLLLALRAWMETPASRGAAR